jgi:hypothetical protein
MKESDVQRSILEYLQIKRVFHFRNNSGAVVSTYKGKNRFFHFGAIGSPDIICVIKGQFVGIEVKRSGGKQNENQINFQKDLEKAGGIYILAYSLDDVIKQDL